MGQGKLTQSFARGVRWRYGAWRYRVPRWVDAATRRRVFGDRAEITLGTDKATAARRHAEIMRELEGDTPAAIHTIADLIDRYLAEVVPTKAEATQRNNRISIQRIRPVFGHMAPGEFASHHAYKYRDLRKDTPTSANRDIEVLSHLFSKAIEWGVLDNRDHPIRGLRIKFQTQDKDRYVRDWEIAEAIQVASPLIEAYIRLALSPLPLRPADMLRLGPQDATDQGIEWHHSKTDHSSGKTTVYPWTDARREAWQFALDARPKQINSLRYLFHTRAGQPYIKADGTYHGFSSIWDRWMKRALERTELTEKFTPMDLRAKVASDSEDLEQARRRLGHTSTNTTRRHYHRRPEIAD